MQFRSGLAGISVSSVATLVGDHRDRWIGHKADSVEVALPTVRNRSRTAIVPDSGASAHGIPEGRIKVPPRSATPILVTGRAGPVLGEHRRNRILDGLTPIKCAGSHGRTAKVHADSLRRHRSRTRPIRLRDLDGGPLARHRANHNRTVEAGHLKGKGDGNLVLALHNRQNRRGSTGIMGEKIRAIPGTADLRSICSNPS